MRKILSEQRLVVLLFVLVLVTFSLAHEDSKKMEQLYFQNVVSASSTPLQQTPPPSDQLPSTVITVIPAR